MAIQQGEAHRRVSLPTYPFARESYWVPKVTVADRRNPGLGPPQLHPLVHRNVSTLTQTKFESFFGAQEFFFEDHQIREAKILPRVAYPGMAVTRTRCAM